MKKILILWLFLLPASLILLSCGSTPSGGGTQTSGLKYRALLTNSVSAGSSAAGVYIVDVQKDIRPVLSPISAGNTPGMMVVTPNRAQTLVFSGNGTQFSDNQFSIINNASESNAAHVALPGGTQSFIVSPDSSSAYVAVPTAPVVGQTPGIIEVIGLNSGTKTGEISCPPVNPTNPVCVWPAGVPQGFNPPYTYLSRGNTGNRILAFSQGSDAVANSVAVITPSSVGTSSPVVTFVVGLNNTSFDHPVWAYFNSDDTTAYVLNCGAECGGHQASVQTLDMTTSPPTPGVPVPVPAATVAFVDNSTMYLAGNPTPASPCTGQTTQATTCGLLTTFDLNSMTVTSTVPITDGYHTHLALGANGQLFIGSRTCTEISTPDETRGCFSIYNTQTGAVVVPPANGDVTGIQPIATRTVVYVIQGGSIGIYDTATDALQFIQITNIVGQFVDVKTIDF